MHKITTVIHSGKRKTRPGKGVWHIGHSWMSSAALPSTTRPLVHEDASCCTGASASSAGAVSIRGVKVHRCCRAQCPRSLSKPLTSARWYKETSGKKYQFRPDVSTVHAHNRARRTHLPRIPIQPHLPARLRCSRPKLASVCPKLVSTYRARLRRAACAAAAGLLQARIAHHDLRWPPARLRRAGCSRPLLCR